MRRAVEYLKSLGLTKTKRWLTGTLGQATASQRPRKVKRRQPIHCSAWLAALTVNYSTHCKTCRMRST